MTQFNISTLPGGVKVVSENIPHLKSFSLGFWFNVGSRDEKHDENGISHFIEHMVFKGTKKRSAKKISEEIESCGGYLNAFTSKEQTCFYGRGMTKYFEKTFEVIADMVQEPLFKQKEIKKEAGVVIDELNDINDNPEELIFDKFEEVLFKGSTLSQPIIGTEKNLLSFDSDKLHEFHQNHYLAGNILIAVSGNVEHHQVVKCAEKYINRISRVTKSKRKLASHQSEISKVIKKDIQQVHCIIGKSSYGYKDDEQRIKLHVLSNILGEGSSSRLFQEVREKLGITYQINSFINSFSDTSTFGVYFSTNSKQVDKVLNVLSKEFNKLRTTEVGARELKRVKEYLKGSTYLSLENTTNRMIRAASSVIYFGKIIPVESFVEKVDNTTSEDIIKLANEVLKEDLLTKIFIRSLKSDLKKAA